MLRRRCTRPGESSAVLPTVDDRAAHLSPLPQAATRSPFLRIAPVLNDLVPKYTLLIQRLATCYEDLAKAHPTHSAATRATPSFAQQFHAFVEQVLPCFEILVKSLAQLREICEDLWRAAGGLLSWLTDGGVAVEVERPDPQGGSHIVTVRESLEPVQVSAVHRTVSKLSMCARSFLEAEREHHHATAATLGGAEDFLVALQKVEAASHAYPSPGSGGVSPRESSCRPSFGAGD